MRYQVRQTRPDTLEICVTPGNGWTSRVAEQIVASFRETLGSSFRYELVVSESLPPLPSGKFQTIIPLGSSMN